MVKAFNQY